MVKLTLVFEMILPRPIPTPEFMQLLILGDGRTLTVASERTQARQERNLRR